MLVASDTINGVAGFEWTVEGDKGAIEVPDALGHELINRPGGHYWAVDGTKPAPKVEPKAEPKVELQEDESTSNDIDEAIEAASVSKTTRTRKTSKE